MAGQNKLFHNLRVNLSALLAGTHSRDHVNGVVKTCHALATSFLSSKSSSGLLIRAQGLPLDDLAYDCIAELFRQDDSGVFVQLQAYFAGVELSSISDEELLSHLRRLVFSKVNHGVFRLCSEADPGLARILRNIRLAVQSLRQWSELERFGEPCLVPAAAETLEHLPPFDRDELLAALVAVASGKEMIPELLGKLARILREQHEQSRIVPLMSAGMAIRACYECKALSPAGTTVEEPTPLIDLRSLVRSACQETRRAEAARYLNREKVTETLLDFYFDVIEDDICVRTEDGGDSRASLFDLMRTRRPELTREEYMREHRNRLEYLLKLVRKRAGRMVNDQ